MFNPLSFDVNQIMNQQYQQQLYSIYQLNQLNPYDQQILNYSNTFPQFYQTQALLIRALATRISMTV